MLREPSNCTGNKSTPDIYIQSSGQQKTQNDKYMPFVVNMVIMCQVHPLSTEMAGENLQLVPKSIPIDTAEHVLDDISFEWPLAIYGHFLLSGLTFYVYFMAHLSNVVHSHFSCNLYGHKDEPVYMYVWPEGGAWTFSQERGAQGGWVS